MRTNPTYNALAQKKVNVNFEQHSDQQGNSYFLVPLIANETPLKIDGQTYHPQPNKPAHFSVYENFDPKNALLSAFHVTWYGYSKKVLLNNNNNNLQEQSIELHIYFDQLGRTVFCRATDQASKKSLTISSVENAQLYRYGREVTATLLNKILPFLTNEYQSKSTEVDTLFSQLEKISGQIETQHEKYKVTAKRCLDAIHEKNTWTFGDKDPRETLLRNTLSVLEVQFTTDPKPKPKKGPQFYQPVIEDNKLLPEKEVPKETHSVEKTMVVTETQQQEKGLLQQLDTIEQEIRQLGKQEKDSEVERALRKEELLQKQFNFVSNALNIVPMERMLDIFQRVNQHHQKLQGLFQKKARDGDIDAVKRLMSFAGCIS